MLDLGGSLGRRFGGIGAGVATPSVLLSATRAPVLTVDAAPDLAVSGAGVRAELPGALDAVRTAAQSLLARYGLDAAGARIVLRRTLPAHQGLGSGTQLALAAARAVAELYDLSRDATHLAQAVGRARRSAIGTYVFGHGGFILEGGRR
jgi:beta-ribofuranosylaminobenzene 5'-phosphate synthase